MLLFQEEEMTLCLRLSGKDCEGEAGHERGQDGVYNATSSRQGELCEQRKGRKGYF